MAVPTVHGWPTLLAIALPVLLAAVFVAAPGDLQEKLTQALRGICAQRPDHSFIVSGTPLALEARMHGIFVGFTAAVTTGWLRGCWRRSELPRGFISVFLVGGIALMGADGVNALLYDTGGPHLYVPRNDLRLVTGLLCGLGTAGFVAPVIGFVFWRERDPRPLFATGQELLWGLAGVGAVGGLVFVPQPTGVLLSAVGLLAVVGAMSLVNAYVWVLCWEGPGRGERWDDLAWASTAGLTLAVGELAGLAALRGWLEATFHISWVV